jgi:hypothetical protein
MVLAKVLVVQRGGKRRGVTDLLYIAQYTQLSGSLGGHIRCSVSKDPLCHVSYTLVRSRHNDVAGLCSLLTIHSHVIDQHAIIRVAVYQPRNPFYQKAFNTDVVGQSDSKPS